MNDHGVENQTPPVCGGGFAREKMSMVCTAFWRTPVGPVRGLARWP